MSSEAAETPISLMQVIVKLMYNCVTEGRNYNTIIDILALVCLVSILSKHASPTIAAPVNQNNQQTNPLQKVLGELSKGDGPGPESLMSLLPLLNSPQMKSKLNPSTISTLLGLMNSLGSADKNEKAEKTEKAAKQNKEAKESQDTQSKETTSISINDTAPTTAIQLPTDEDGAAVVTEAQVLNANKESDFSLRDTEHDRKYTGKALNWKGNFSI